MVLATTAAVVLLLIIAFQLYEMGGSLKYIAGALDRISRQLDGARPDDGDEDRA